MAITEWELRRAAVGQGDVNIILCDDDPVFLRELHSEIDRTYTRLNMKATIWDFQSPQDLSAEQFATCDIAFLDIDFEREDCNGIDVARRLRQVNGRALILFVTNYIDYAPEGFEVQAFRYILKRDMGEVLERYILQAMETMSESKEYLQLREKEQRIDLPLEQISYLEVLDHYVSIHTKDVAYTIGATLSSMESQMEAHGFLRIHKSYLVNMCWIRKFRSRECVLIDGTTLAVSEKNYSQQKQKYLLWKGLK